jgi:protein TonB
LAAACLPDGGGAASTAFRGVRTILVPPDIVGVARRLPPRAKRRTPWQPQPDGVPPAARAGSRDWFTDNLFVEAHDGHDGVGYGLSLGTHAIAAIALVIVIAARPDQIVARRFSAPLVMPAIAVDLPRVELVSATAAAAPRLRPEAQLRPPAAPPPPRMDAVVDAVAPAAPIEAPGSITPETGNETARPTGVDGGVDGGLVGGVPGGIANGAVVGGVADGTPSVAAPVRLAKNMTPPRKIKDVKPVYPAGGASARTQGAVIIEATVGVDGKVRDARVVHSAPPLDQAALDAVRQWEYTPALLNSVAVAVIVTVVVNFSLQ